MEAHEAKRAERREEGGATGRVLVVTGPTAAGKSALALELARRFDAEIVNADSMQVYRYMDIGTAKPSLEERASAPHHLFDVVTPDIEYNAARYSHDAREAMAAIHARGRLPLLTGGTGLYIRAALEGLVATGGVEPELRARLERKHRRAVAEGEPRRLYDRLSDLDPEAASTIHPNDVRRTLRALEIIEQSGTSASSLRARHAFADRPYRTLHLALDPGRSVVAERIERRCAAMIEAGLLREVRALRARGYGPDLRPMQSIGYRHMAPVVDGQDTLTNACEAMRADTRRFARRQRTWLRRKVQDVVWLDPRDESAVLRAVEAFLAADEQAGA